MKRKLRLLTLSILVMLMLLSACSQSKSDTVKNQTDKSDSVETTEGDNKEAIELRVWVAHPLRADYEDRLAENPEDKLGLMTKKIKDMFEESHPNVKLVLEDKGWDKELKQQIMLAVLGGTGPDVTMGEAFIPEFVKLGALAPIELGDLADELAPSSLQAATLDGKVYGVSGWTGVSALQYNKKVMEEAGLDPNSPPTTLDELVDMSKTVYENSNGEVAGMAILGTGGLGAAFRYAILMRQFGGWFVNDDETEATINSEANVKAMEYWRELAKYTLDRQVYMTDAGQVLGIPHKDQAAFQIDGPWQIDWTKADGNDHCDYAIVPFNDGAKRGNLIVGNAIFSVLQQSKHKEMAEEFVKFMGTPDVQMEIYRGDARIPSNLTAAKNPEIIESRPEMAAFIDELENSDSAPLPGYEKDSSDIYVALDTMFMDVLTTERPIKEILDEAQGRISELLQ